jgi:hypothetical protein
MNDFKVKLSTVFFTLYQNGRHWVGIRTLKSSATARLLRVIVMIAATKNLAMRLGKHVS